MQVASCINCNESLLIEEKQTQQVDTRTPPPTDTLNNVKPNDSELDDRPIVSLGLNLGILCATIILPIIGIAMGFTYIRKGYPSTVKAGKTWLIFVNLFLIGKLYS